MIGLFDRDVFLKLGCCNLWVEAVGALEITRPYRLQATSSERSNRRKLQKLLGEGDHQEALRRIQGIVRQVPVLSDELIDGITASDGFKVLAGIDGIDDGEQILGAILINNPSGRVLVSGDKRFVNAFRSELPEQWETVSSGVISFEACLLAIERRFGFEYVVERASPARHCDETLRLAIGQVPALETFRQALSSYDPCRVVEAA